jgi:hypothetical protein
MAYETSADFGPHRLTPRNFPKEKVIPEASLAEIELKKLKKRGVVPKDAKFTADGGAFEVQTEEHADGFKKNFVVKTPMARVMRPKVNKGRPKNLTPRQMHQGCNSYFKWCEKNDRVPSIKGMMLHMKMMRDAFYRYVRDPEYSDILEQAKLVITEWIENDIYRTPGQAAGKIAYAKNIIDWADKIDTTSINENRNTTIVSVEDARAKIASLVHLINPEILEALTGNYALRSGTREQERPREIEAKHVSS